MPVGTAPELRFGVANEELTGLVKYLGLAEALARGVPEAAPTGLSGRADAAVADLQPVCRLGPPQRSGRLAGGRVRLQRRKNFAERGDRRTRVAVLAGAVETLHGRPLLLAPQGPELGAGGHPR